MQVGHGIITGYGGSGIRIGENYYTSPIICSAQGVEPMDVSTPEALTTSKLMPLFEQANQIDVVLIGCGARLLVLPDIQSQLRSKGMAVEVMDTGAACRVYNTLVTEGRRVAALLFPVTHNEAASP